MFSKGVPREYVRSVAAGGWSVGDEWNKLLPDFEFTAAGDNLNEAAQACAQFLTVNRQGCMLATRVYLHEDIADEVLAQVEKITDAYEDNLRSDPLAEGTWSSPLFHRAQRARVLNFIKARKKEATLLRGRATTGD
jgi:aldehyde dehydrogenase (NAD+)